MPKVTTGFFSFTEVTDPAAHHSYNEWHQLDHMPEQVPLTGIVYGQRWVWPPERRTSSQDGDVTAVAPFDRVHYVTLYLMQEPLDETLAEFLELGHELARRGRFHRRRDSHLSGPFALIDARASERVLVSAEAIPYRPHCGIRVIVESFVVDQEEQVRYRDWWRNELAPQLCVLDGVAGVWQFETSTRFDAHQWRPGEPAPRRVAVVWIDGALGTTSRELARFDRIRDARAAGVAVAEMVATLETITPGQWNWFDRGVV